MTQHYHGAVDWMTQWWRDHEGDPPLVVIKCGRGEPRCGKRIAEIKRDGEITMALRKMVRPEPTVPSPRGNWIAQTVTELEERIAEREQHVLKRFDTDEGPMEVMKQRRDLAAAVAPLAMFSTYCCPHHGEITVDKEHLAKFVAQSDDTQSVTSTYWLPHRDVD